MISSEEEEYRYLTVGELGKGGMGIVWEMHDTALNRRIAFKQMHPDLIGTKSIEDRFLNEAKILARLEHPGIVPIHELDVSSEDGAWYYTMEKVRGESLQSVLDNLKKRNKATVHRWTMVRLMSAFNQLCETVAFAHGQGILHRDLKPDNVMLGRFGEVFLVDWGIAKEIGTEETGHEDDHVRIQQTRLTDGGTSLFAMENNLFGTPGYMSPEAASGEDNYTDGGSDIFALGAILYQILTLTPPYQGADPATIIEAAIQGQIPPVAEAGGLRPHLPDGKTPDALVAIANMALSPDRQNRYATAQEMRRDIEAFLQGHPTKAQEASPLKMMQLFVKRHPGTTFVWVIAAVAVISIFLSGLKQNVQNRLEAERELKLALEEKEAFFAEKAGSNADRAEAAPRFAELAWDRIKLGDVNRARYLANAALEFNGDPESDAKSHLVLGLTKVLEEIPEQAEKHFELAEEVPFLLRYKRMKEEYRPVNWPDILERDGLYALAVNRLNEDPDKQFEKLQAFLTRQWDPQFWELSKGLSNRSVFYRLVLKSGIEPSRLDFIMGWPIHHLILDEVPLADLGRLSDLPELRILELKSGHLTKDLSPLSELKKLTSLSIAPLKNSPDFGFDLTPLASLGRLNQLDIEANVLSLDPTSALKLTHLRTGRLLRNSSLLPLRGMPLRFLTVENPTDFEGLTGTPLQQFRPGYTTTGYTKLDIEILANLPIKEVRLDGDFHEEFVLLTKCRKLEKLETDHLHDLKIWGSTPLKNIHLKGSDHDLSGLADSSIAQLTLSSNTPDLYRTRPVLYPLLRAIQLSEVRLPEIDHPEYHVHLETPALSEGLINKDWPEVDKEFRRLQARYTKHNALADIGRRWLPVLEEHIKNAKIDLASETWHPEITFGNHIYQWFKTPMNWHAAQDMAEKLDGHLVTVESVGEWKFLETEFGIPLDADSVWTGGSNRIWTGSIEPGAALSVVTPAIRNRPGEAASIYISGQKLVLSPTSPQSQWSFIIEWDQ